MALQVYAANKLAPVFQPFLLISSELFLIGVLRTGSQLGGEAVIFLPVLLPSRLQVIRSFFAVGPLVGRILELFQREAVLFSILTQERILVELAPEFGHLPAQSGSFIGPPGNHLAQLFRLQGERRAFGHDDDLQQLKVTRSVLRGAFSEERVANKPSRPIHFNARGLSRLN